MKSLAALAWICVAQIASASSADALAARFVDVLRRDDPAVATALLTTDASWPELRDLVSRFDCISVSRYTSALVSAEADLVKLRVDLEGSAEWKAEWRPRQPLPATWHIEARRIDGEWRIARVMTEEHRVALAMFDARDDAEAERILVESPHVDARDVLPHYASALEFARVARRFERLEHAADMARRFADESTEIFALRKQLDPLSQLQDPRAFVVAARLEELARAWGSKDDLAGALLTIGLVRLRMAGRSDAVQTYRSCASMAEWLNDPTTAIKCHQMLYFSSDATLQTLSAIERIDELAQRYRWEEGEELVLSNRAILHGNLGDMDRVYETHIKGLALTERRGNWRRAGEAMFNLAGVEMARGNHAEAVRWLRQYLTRFGSNHGYERLLASALTTIGALDEAEALLRRAEPRASDLKGCTDYSVRLARIHLARGNAQGAIAETNQALRHIDPTKGEEELKWMASALATRAHAFRKAGRLEDAAADLRSAVEMFEAEDERIGGDALTRALMQEDYDDLYVELAETLVAQEEIEAAFRVTEQRKARGLRHATSGRRIDTAALMSDAERAREDSLEKSVVALNRELIRARQSMTPIDGIEGKLTVLRSELDMFRTEMRLKYPTIARRDAEPALSSYTLPKSMAAIEYIVAESQVLAFVLANGSLQVVQLPLRRDVLERDAREVVELVSARSPGYASAAKRLHAALLAPLEQHLRGAKVLVIIPDGALWTVPFHALIASDGAHEIERRAIFYAHSLSLLQAATSVPKHAQMRLLALGNPSIGASTSATLRSARELRLGSLQAAEEEVRSLASMYSRGCRVLYREHAKEAVFKEEAPRYGILHVAAHAYAESSAPMYSAIVLATDDPREDGLLEAREVVDLSLNAELAVLSACETARGKVGSGEGVIGLPWAFFAAGVPTTIVSQWSAESSATAKLMVEMHRRLLDGETIADALRGAQLAVRSEPRYRHPFYWAPFVAIGAAGRELTK